MQLTKRFVVMSSLAIVAGVGTSAVAQSFLPGGGGLGDILGGGGGLGEIYRSDGLGDIFGGNGSGVGDIFSDVLGGSSGSSGNGGGGLGGVLGGIDPCNSVIVNFAPTDSNCGGSGSGGGLGGLANEILTGGGSADSIFDTVFDVVGSELGLPDEITGVITGKNSIEGIFEEILDDALASIGIENGDAGGGGASVGAAGIPTYESMLEALATGEDGSADAASQGLLTPNVISSLLNPTMSMSALTDVVTGRVLGEQGQQMMVARNTAGKTVTETSANMGQTANVVSQAQVAVAESINEKVLEQESTQDTLKEALTGMNLLAAQATQFDSIAANQRALGNQLGAINLDVAQDISATSAVNGRSLALTNKQLQKTSQENMAEKASLRSEFGVAVRSLGAMR